MAKRKVGELLRINLTVPLWFIIGAGVLAFLISYLCAAQHRDQIKFAAVLLGAAAGIYSAYYVGAALRLQLSRERQKASFELLGLLNRPEFVKVRNFLEREVEGHEKLSAEELYAKVDGNDELDNAVTVVMDILEDMSIAIQNDYAEEEILRLSLVCIVERNWNGLRGWVEQLRKKHGDQRLFSELQKLATSWESGKRLCDGRELPVLPK